MFCQRLAIALGYLGWNKKGLRMPWLLASHIFVWSFGCVALWFQTHASNGPLESLQLRMTACGVSWYSWTSRRIDFDKCLALHQTWWHPYCKGSRYHDMDIDGDIQDAVCRRFFPPSISHSGCHSLGMGSAIDRAHTRMIPVINYLTI